MSIVTDVRSSTGAKQWQTWLADQGKEGKTTLLWQLAGGTDPSNVPPGRPIPPETKVPSKKVPGIVNDDACNRQGRCLHCQGRTPLYILVYHNRRRGAREIPL